MSDEPLTIAVSAIIPVPQSTRHGSTLLRSTQWVLARFLSLL